MGEPQRKTLCEAALKSVSIMNSILDRSSSFVQERREPAAMSGLTLIDVLCNDRVYLAGTIGMGLQRDRDGISYQTATEGNHKTGHHL